ncbi:PfkB family carbohydrate kinase [Roseomonas elaeocarpi]|uniref:PfkB family carbohydrate kinase n=1 Tax=Roseomonas elaeocarpi TaxID=907779 RepID=A0ABV6JNF5_9PROT
MSARVCCLGMAVLDQVWELPALPDTAAKFVAHGFRESGGGMAATAAVAVAALGGRAAWHGRLGDDAAGDTVLGLLQRYGVDPAGAVRAPGSRTAVSGILVDDAGERMLAVFRGSGLPNEPRFSESWLDGAGAVLSDPRWTEGAAQLFRLAAARGLPRVLDADTAAVTEIRILAPLADHVVFSQRGLAEFSGVAEPGDGLRVAAERLWCPGARTVLAVTLGERGSLWWQDGETAALPAPRVAVRDTNGCGDVFHGAYALALAEGRDVPAAARFATAAAALKAARGGGWGGMPDRAAVDELLDRAAADEPAGRATVRETLKEKRG